ncbi:MAG TPA: hypothetical protein VJM33_07715 [Microthrixaceae bacterium]|nr:hypothetical protein [Microthrixaceae bacterium]
MARPPKDLDAAVDLGRRLTTLRQAISPPPSFARIVVGVLVAANVDISIEQVRRFHYGQVDPHHASPEHLVGLATFYGVSVDDLGPAVGGRLNDLDRLIRTGSSQEAVAA